MTAEFALADRIAAESIALADFELCHVRLMDDARYPWLLLVPRIAGLEEWTDLNATDQALLSAEIVRAGTALKAVEPFDKLNVAALGNIVRQMHVHIIGRRIGDPAWPGAVWGQGARIPYVPDRLRDISARLRNRFAG